MVAGYGYVSGVFRRPARTNCPQRLEMRVTTRTTAWAGIDIGKIHHWICLRVRPVRAERSQLAGRVLTVLVIASAADSGATLFAAVLRRLVGPVGIFLTVIVIIQFGNPSSGGANGVPTYLSSGKISAHSCRPATPICSYETRSTSTDTAPARHSRSCSPMQSSLERSCSSLIGSPTNHRSRCQESRKTDDEAVLAPVGPPP